ncbi:unnamed protein product [Paramecium octaurelia]|uniref:Uncharacterized protein n=1 Tax=Paramecium octaurelia TaxID=43137 RepID=A0A8S1TF31_PAROT|nr:unnamed protein product [Paramecium octaurelia]
MIKNIYQEARAPNRHITNVKFKPIHIKYMFQLVNLQFTQFI